MQMLIITLVFEKNANFVAENWQKSQKIVIITSTPDKLIWKQLYQPTYFSLVIGIVASMYFISVTQTLKNEERLVASMHTIKEID
jgi:sensor c-di-GMP phosphodiesterase-like protein